MIMVSFYSNKILTKTEIKEIQIGKKEVKVSFFADDNIVHIHDPKKFSMELLKLINTFHNIVEYKVNL